MTEIIWLKSLIHELHIQTPSPQLFSDNLGVVLLSANLVMHSKFEHFELDLHFVRDNVQNHVVQVVHIPDIFKYSIISPNPSLILHFFVYVIN